MAIVFLWLLKKFNTFECCIVLTSIFKQIKQYSKKMPDNFILVKNINIMKRILNIAIAILALFAVISQYILMVQTRNTSFAEATIRYFSYFTMLTNLMVAAYFTFQVLIKNKPTALPNKPGALTALSVYIIVVGLVYQFFLRSTWNPGGLQRIVDELLHSVIPVIVLVYCFAYENFKHIRYSQLLNWLTYPLIYLIFIMSRGYFSGFYPYFFVNVSEIGFKSVMINSFFLLILFLLLSFCFTLLGKKTKTKG